MRWVVSPRTIQGRIEVPGDKSIAHRALILASLARGTSTIENLPDGEDVRSTARCMSALGVHIGMSGQTASIRSNGRLVQPEAPLDAGNSGTTMRLLAGVLAAQTFRSCLTGDASLRRRPMQRVVEPLERMGANMVTVDGHAPLDILGTPLNGIRYVLPIPSAQVKSCILLAGLFARGETRVVESVPSRDHTERMLGAMGIEVSGSGHEIVLRGGQELHPFRSRVPGDASSAAFPLAAAALTGGELTVTRVGVNSTRTGFLSVLQRMGAALKIDHQVEESGEPVADVTVSGSAYNPVEIEAKDVPLLIDEIPLIALLATQARGESHIRGAAELRHKETDRITAVAVALSALGADIEELPDGFIIRGPRTLSGARVQSDGDHRLAMMLAVAGCVASGPTHIEGAEAAAVSYPEFVADFGGLGANIGCA